MMTTLYNIVKSLQEAQGSIAKQEILMQHKDNELFKEYMRAVYDPSINWYQKRIPKHKDEGMIYESYKFGPSHIGLMLYHLAERNITGRQAERWLGDLYAAGNSECKELIKLMIDRSIGASVGSTMVLKTWPDLYFSVPYMRCSLLDTKAKEKFSKLPLMFVQEKCDGSFLYLVKEAGKAPEAITRAGSTYPREFAEKLAEGVPDGVVLIGELLVYDGNNVLDRQTGNGMLNSILKGGDVDDNFDYRMSAWDFITPEELKAGKSVWGYAHRLDFLDKIEATHIDVLQTIGVSTLERAYELYSKYTAQGKEGAVLKTPDFLWKDGTSKDCVKMKIEFEVDLEITHITEGTGKATGMMGSVGVKSSCGKLVCDVGTGWSDEARKYIWAIRDTMRGNILALKANDIISKRGSDTKSLFLPVAIEIRFDKNVADSLEDCEKILNAAKGLK
jgi:DNA ligase-1